MRTVHRGFMSPKTASSCQTSLDLAWLSCTISVAKQVLVTRTPPLIRFQRILGPPNHYQPFTRLGEDFKKIDVFNVLKRSRGCSRLLKFTQRFPTNTLGQKINLVQGKKPPATHRKDFKEFLDFPKIAQ